MHLAFKCYYTMHCITTAFQSTVALQTLTEHKSCSCWGFFKLRYNMCMIGFYPVKLNTFWHFGWSDCFFPQFNIHAQRQVRDQSDDRQKMEEHLYRAIHGMCATLATQLTPLM